MITAGVCNSYLAELFAGVHSKDDAYALALFTDQATLNADTRAYNPANEAVGRGYTPGGILLKGLTVGLDGSGVATLGWNTDPELPEASLTARAGLIYNRTKSNRGVAVLDFGENVTSTNAPYLIQLPRPVLRLGVVKNGG